MDAVTYIKEKARMCGEQGENCNPRTCPYGHFKGCDAYLLEKENKTAEAIQILQDWIDEHPRKTRQSVFLEQWPEASMKYGIPTIKPCDLYSKYKDANGDCTRHGINCAQCCREFWSQEVE